MNAPVTITNITIEPAQVPLKVPTRDRAFWTAESRRQGTDWESIGQVVARMLPQICVACDTCGRSPCRNPSWCGSCRRADAAAAKARKQDKPVKRPTPDVTVEAVLHAVRARGPQALQEPANVERLAACDRAAVARINSFIEKLKGEAK
jgi:hypothetical protein